MQLFVLVLNNTEQLEPLFKKMLERDFRGATVLDSTGMMRVLSDDENVDLPMLSLLRHIYTPERKASKTVFIVLKDEQVSELSELIDEVTGGLDKPNTGIAFSMPLSFVKGWGKK